MKVEAMIKEQVLLVDSDSDTWLTRRAITKRHSEHEVIHFDEGEDLLDYLDTRLNVLPKLIFLDTHSPGMNGLEVLRLLKSNARYAHIPVLMLIPSQNSMTVLELYEAGATSCIIKPLNDLKFTEALINLDYLVAIAERR